MLLEASLLQDAGLLLLHSDKQKNLQEDDFEKHSETRRHPELSSALTGRTKQAPCEMLFLISQHHERLDGIFRPEDEAGLHPLQVEGTVEGFSKDA